MIAQVADNPEKETEMHSIPFSPFPPGNRILTTNPQLLTLSTNRGIATTLRLPLPTRLARQRHTTTVPGGGRVLPGYSDLRIARKEMFLLGVVAPRGRLRLDRGGGQGAETRGRIGGLHGAGRPFARVLRAI